MLIHAAAVLTGVGGGAEVVCSVSCWYYVDGSLLPTPRDHSHVVGTGGSCGTPVHSHTPRSRCFCGELKDSGFMVLCSVLLDHFS